MRRPHSAKIIFTLCLLLMSSFSQAQRCNSAIEASAADWRYERRSNGDVFDKVTKRLWSACSLGQYWKDNGCQGEALRLSFDEARARLKKGWRLPEIAELNTLVELRCTHSAVNHRFFSATQAAPYWSATAFIHQPEHYWQVHFLEGESAVAAGQRSAFTRLLRDDENMMKTRR
jgi:Protein of unknown function (DUF1566)